jgi:hypothetical protein
MPNNMKSLKLPTFIMFALISILLFIGINKWMHFLLTKDYVVECLTNPNQAYTHTVNLPINTTYSCKNMCGPYGKCSITGERCLSDIDCFGCKPSTSELSNTFLKTNNVEGDNDAGKYSYLTPNYSELTTDVGTRAKLIEPSDKFTPPPAYNTGVNMWRAQFDQGESLYDEVYKPPANLANIPSYPPRYSLSGQFTENGPLASNAYLQ